MSAEVQRIKLSKMSFYDVKLRDMSDLRSAEAHLGRDSRGIPLDVRIERRTRGF